jgi:hypothetical protein
LRKSPNEGADGCGVAAGDFDIREPWTPLGGRRALIEKTGCEIKENIGDFGPRGWLIGCVLDEKARSD